LALDKNHPLLEIESEFEKGLEGVSEKDTRAQLVKIERALDEYTKSRKIPSHLYDNILKLKYLHQRYTNYLKWLEWKE